MSSAKRVLDGEQMEERLIRDPAEEDDDDETMQLLDEQQVNEMFQLQLAAAARPAAAAPSLSLPSGTKRVLDGGASAQLPRNVRTRVSGEVEQVQQPPSWMEKPPPCNYINQNGERCPKVARDKGRCNRHPECTEPGCTKLVAGGGSA